jgi:hypothetical protein
VNIPERYLLGTNPIDWTAIDARHGLPDLAGLKREAEHRVDAHAQMVNDWEQELGKDPRPPMTPEERAAEITRRTQGLIGERQVARIIGVRMRLGQPGTRGDQRTNLISPYGIPIDVSCRTPPGFKGDQAPDLLLKVHEPARPELALVLCAYLGEERDPWVMGWAWEVDVRRDGRITHLAGQAKPCYLVLPGRLRPINALAAISPRGADSTQVAFA